MSSVLYCIDPTPLTENVWLGEIDSDRSGDDADYAYGSDGYEDEEEWDSGISPLCHSMFFLV